MITPELIYEVLKRRSLALPDDHEVDLIAHHYLDSLMLVDVLSELEAEFDISLPDDAMKVENFRTVKQIAKTFQSARGAKGGE